MKPAHIAIVIAIVAVAGFWTYHATRPTPDPTPLLMGDVKQHGVVDRKNSWLTMFDKADAAIRGKGYVRDESGDVKGRTHVGLKYRAEIDGIAASVDLIRADDGRVRSITASASGDLHDQNQVADALRIVADALRATFPPAGIEFAKITPEQCHSQPGVRITERERWMMTTYPNFATNPDKAEENQHPIVVANVAATGPPTNE